MELQLTGSGLAEGRDPEAYVVHLRYALFYPNASGQPARRAEYSTPIYASVHAVPVAERSVQGTVPSGGVCAPTLSLSLSLTLTRWPMRADPTDQPHQGTLTLTLTHPNPSPP